MADPATQFQQSGIQTPGYTPVETHLNQVIPFQGHTMWEGVSKAINESLNTALNSALNPAVRAQMKASGTAANFRTSVYQDAIDHPEKYHGLVGIQGDTGIIEPRGTLTQAMVTGPGYGGTTTAPKPNVNPNPNTGDGSNNGGGQNNKVVTPPVNPPAAPNSGEGSDSEKGYAATWFADRGYPVTPGDVTYDPKSHLFSAKGHTMGRSTILRDVAGLDEQGNSLGTGAKPPVQNNNAQNNNVQNNNTNTAGRLTGAQVKNLLRQRQGGTNVANVSDEINGVYIVTHNDGTTEQLNADQVNNQFGQ